MGKLIKILFSTMTVFVVVLFASAYLTLLCEAKAPGANIKTYQDALWWCLHASSVGNSNVFPITAGGRLVGAFVIVVGYGLFTINVGAISAALTHAIRGPHYEKLLKELCKNDKSEVKSDPAKPEDKQTVSR